MSAANSEKSVTKPIGRPFVKGQSGNPSGRPKSALVSEAYRAKLASGDPTVAERLADMMARRALKGDVAAAKELTDRAEGKARQAVELSNPDGSLASAIGIESAVKLLALRGITVVKSE